MTKIEIQNFDELPSTNSYAITNMHDLHDKDVIVANTQTMGRGRLGRKWLSDNPGNIYCSIVLKPTNHIKNDLPLANLTQYTSVVLAKVIDSYKVESRIKWPNDVLVDDKKIAGILAESSTFGVQLNGVVVGVGMNINCKHADMYLIDQPATSLNLEVGTTNINREDFLQKFIDNFFENYDEFMETGFDFIKSDYVKKCSFLGKEIGVSDLGNKYNAIAKNINNDGSLEIEKIIEENDNELKNIRIGDIYVK